MKQLLLLLISILSYSVGSSQSNEFIGVLPGGGPHETGVIYKTDSVGNFKTLVYTFEKAHGRGPVGELALAPDSSFFGIASGGGFFNKGTLFQYFPSQKKYKTLYHFGSKSMDGTKPLSGVILCTNGKLYGSTSEGGTYNKGTLFYYDLAADSLTIFHSFTNTNASGFSPRSAFVETMSGVLLIITYSGGAFNYGAIYKVDTATHTTSKVADFNHPITGSFPVGDLVEHSPNEFYGVTGLGGGSNKGVLFRFNLSTNTLTKMKDFVNNTTGEYPSAGLMLASNGKLYGTTYSASSNADVLFEYNTSDSSLTKLYEFTPTKGDNPHSVLVEGQNNILYGTTRYGGNASDDGSIYAYRIGTDSIIKLFSFQESIYGANPSSGMTFGKDGKLYGLVGGGSGLAINGALYSFDLSTNTFERPIFFNSSKQGTFPVGKLVQAADERVYGVTQGGGENNNGIVYSINDEGLDFKVEADFADTLGRSMDQGLLEASNGKLYGVCQYGINNNGTIIEFDPITKSLIKRAVFEGVEFGQWGAPGLTEGDGGILYGIRAGGGAYSNGTLYSYNINTHELKKLHDFNQTVSGRSPQGRPVLVNGKLYGITYTGGATDEGVLYEYNLANNTCKIKISFTRNVTGKRPVGSLFLANNGLLYGTTTEGGDYSVGSLFEYNIATNTLLVKASFFRGAKEEQGTGELMQGSNGHIYGLTYKGGDYDAGVLYEYRIGTKVLTRTYHLQNELHGNYANSALLELNQCKFTKTTTLHNEISARAINQEYQWLNCDENYKVIPGETNKNFKPKGNGNYAVEITSRFCKDTSACINMVLQSASKTVEDFISIYPNPSNGFIHLDIKQDDLPMQIQVINSLGKVCHEETITNSNSVLSKYFQTGVYFILLQQGQTHYTYKVAIIN